jgi:hypothetical protein
VANNDLFNWAAVHDEEDAKLSSVANPLAMDSLDPIEALL